jgi:sugar diacid utilization regulator
LRALHVLAMIMTRARDEGEIIRLATSAVPSFSACRAVGVHLDGRWLSVDGSPGGGDGDLEARASALGTGGGPLLAPGLAWGWAYPLASVEGVVGHLVTAAEEEPPEHERFVLRALAEQAGASLANARLHARERAGADQLRTSNLALEHSIAAVQRTIAIHECLTSVALAGHGRDGIAHAVHELTGLPVVIEDRYGNLGAWAGPGRPDPYPKQPAGPREAMLARATSRAHALREGDRLLALARTRDHVMGVIALVDPDATAGEVDEVALEYGATVLALEVAHLRALAEIELRLRRDLVEALLTGTGDERILERAGALGYDLERPHRTVVVEGGNPHHPDLALFDAVRRAARDEGVGTLLADRTSCVVVLSDADQDWSSFRQRILEELGGGSCRIGVGASCPSPADLPNSYRQAQLALKIQRSSAAPGQVSVFEDLGVYRVLAEVPDTAALEGFIRQWLGPLLDYDASRGSDLVATLSAYLECGGSYDTTATALSLHRSTLRYRLRRLREVSGLDLGDPDIRFNLQLATRAWRTAQALREEGSRDTGWGGGQGPPR